MIIFIQNVDDINPRHNNLEQLLKNRLIERKIVPITTVSFTDLRR
jgi:hypothetical protein